MIQFAHETAMDAPAESIWSVATQVELWPDWLPTVTAARRLSRRPFGMGSRFELKQPLLSAAIWEVTEYTPGASFAWRRLGGRQLRLEARHEVLRPGATPISRLGLSCSGPLSVLLWPILRSVFALALREENAALKRRCETGDVTAARHPGLQGPFPIIFGDCR